MNFEWFRFLFRLLVVLFLVCWWWVVVCVVFRVIFEKGLEVGCFFIVWMVFWVFGVF